VRFRFIDAEKAFFPVRILCRVLQVRQRWVLRLAFARRERAGQVQLADGRAVAQVTRTQATPEGPVTATQVTYLHPDGQGSVCLD
jgi:hypothetical protein